MKVVIALLCTTLAAAPSALVNNSGFENVNERNGLPSAWGYTYLPGKSDLVQYKVASMSDAKNDKALAITISKDHPNQRVAYNAFQHVRGIENGKTYQVSARVQTRGLETLPMVVIQCIDQSGKKFVGFARSPQRQLQQDIKEWESIETEVTVPEGTAGVLIRAGIPSQGNTGGTAFLDDITVTEIKTRR